jgi:arylsulfatase A-like enzyme
MKRVISSRVKGGGARLMMLVFHDDAEREYAYGPDRCQNWYAAQTPAAANALKEPGCATGQFGKNHMGDRNEFLLAAQGSFHGWCLSH